MPKISKLTILILCMKTFASYSMHYNESINNYKLFKTIQKIRLLTNETRMSCEENDIFIDGGTNTPNPNSYQTSQGLILLASKYPNSLATPWGKVELTGACYTYDNVKLLVFYQALLKKFRASFSGVMELQLRNYVTIYTPKNKLANLKLLSDDNYDNEAMFTRLFKEIPLKSLNNKIGDDDLIVVRPTLYNTVTYQIQEVSGYQLPVPEFLPAERRHSPNEIISSWNALQEQFKKDDPFNQKRRSH